ncbi:MAG: proteasome accessory factor PafA2 family protein [Planctomycetes bacterium]|nr:proteasome accessory factor PafA2 family protein [Planctomycetota bacterium]
MIGPGNGAARERADGGRRRRPLVPKVIGTDTELANFVAGIEVTNGTGREASRALLRAIPGVLARDLAPAACTCGTPGSCRCGFDPQDWGRRFLPSNGGCAYIDMNHLELCTPEVLDALELVAAWHAMLRIGQDALAAANAGMPEGLRIAALVNNSDGQGSSYGHHVSLLTSREAFENLFHRRLHHLLYLASYLVSSILFAGAGKVGSEAGEAADYQISQRADFFSVLTSPTTTHERPIVNSRDECHADREALARLHLICFDSTLCHGATFLKAGVTQVVLAMIEDGRVSTDLILDDPVGALHAWSRSPELTAAARLTGGERYTALDMQWAFLERASRFVATGRADGVVPRAHDVMALWEDTLERLERDPRSLARRLDWVLKRDILERAMDSHGLDWSAPEIKYLDHLYASLDPGEGLYWAQERSGAVERLVDGAEIERLVRAPPADTRAWTRAQILRRWGYGEVVAMDWDSVQLRAGPEDPGAGSRTFRMRDPLGLTRGETRRVFREAQALGATLDMLEALEANRVRRPGAQGPPNQGG